MYSLLSSEGNIFKGHDRGSTLEKLRSFNPADSYDFIVNFKQFLEIFKRGKILV